MDSKTDLRQEAKEIRKTLDIEYLSQILTKEIRNLQLYQKARNVLLYCPMKYEINLLELLNNDKNFYLPRVSDNQLLICPFKLGDKLEKSSLNIKEPCSNPVSSAILDLAIVPALMVDYENYRLGYGGGFYDRFLSKNPHIKTVVAVSKKLYVKTLPHDKFDIPIDEVLIG